MEKNQRRKILAAVTRFETAAVNLSWRGGSHPDDHEEIDRKYVLAKAHLYRVCGLEVTVDFSV